eukprot:1279391-Amphidinium_carterae.1
MAQSYHGTQLQTSTTNSVLAHTNKTGVPGVLVVFEWYPQCLTKQTTVMYGMTKNLLSVGMAFQSPQNS